MRRKGGKRSVAFAFRSFNLHCLKVFKLILHLRSLFNCFDLVSQLSHAAKLSVLLHVCVLDDSPLYICLCILLGLHPENHGIGGDNHLESNDQDPRFDCLNSLHFYFNVVCWRPHCFPLISHRYKSGHTFYPPLQMVTSLQVSFSFDRMSHFICYLADHIRELPVQI